MRRARPEGREPMAPEVIVPLGVLSVMVALAIVWWDQTRSHNANLVDPVWSWTLGWLGVLFAIFGSAPAPLRLLLAVLAGGWGFRLGLHLYLRNHGKPEDARYARFRQKWGAHADRNMFWFLEFQAILSAVLAGGFVVVAWRDDWPPAWAVTCAVVAWVVAVAGEALSDAQLARFRRDPANRGRVNRDGLWRYSRHPNYFFETLHWFTYVFLAVGTAGWWVALVAPAVMAWLLLKLSGIPMTEAQMAKSKPGYAEYIRTTSAFIPWPPKRDG